MPPDQINLNLKPKALPEKQRKLSVLIFLINLLMLAAVIWIIFPSQSYYIWLFSVLASEWSLCFGIVALFGTLCALFIGLKNGGRLWVISFLAGASAFAISLYPFLSTYQVGQTLNTSLSFSGIFFGILEKRFEF